jgi:alanyl-tRNA synthetase
MQDKTELLYLTDTYLFESNARVVRQGYDEKGRSYIVLDQTIFHPQGGGQPCDHGIVDNLQIVAVKKASTGEIFHYYDTGVPDILPDSVVKCVIDKDRRMLNAKYHTAGHLVSSVVEEMNSSLKATKCHAFPGEAYVEFPQASAEPDVAIIQNRLSEVLKIGAETKIFDISAEDFEKSFYKLPYDIPDRQTFRVLQIGIYPPVPCGGTHVKNISEVEDITVRVNSRKGVIKVSYSLP